MAMRSAIFIAWVGVVVLSTQALFAGEQAEKKSAPGKLESVESLQALALKKSVDIKVAEAQVRLAQAELERAQASVRANVATLHRDLQTAYAGEEEAKKRSERAQKLYEEKVISAEDLNAAVLTYRKLRNDRNGVELRLKMLVDGAPLETKSEKK
jgi:hypothetical protein